MTEALIFDAVRTPRGKGKKDGALYSVKPVSLLAGLLRALQERNGLDTRQVDDVVLGCVTPVGDQGADIAKTAVMAAESIPPDRNIPRGTSAMRRIFTASRKRA